MKKRFRVICPECGKRKEYTNKNFYIGTGLSVPIVGRGCRNIKLLYSVEGTTYKWNKEEAEWEVDRVTPLCLDCIKWIMKRIFG